MKKIVFAVISLFPMLLAKAQPFQITAYIDSTVIQPTDQSSLQSIVYSGQAMNWVFDRRVNDWTEINTFLFDITYDDGITSQVQINPEFGSIQASALQAEKYAFIFGQLPACLRIGVDKIWIHQGTESFGGGFNAVLIHTGQSSAYEQLGILEEVLVHEATHTSIDPVHSTSAGWTNSQNSDGGFISTYAASSIEVEDLAESFLAWIMVRQCSRRISIDDSATISQVIPYRLAYFDSQNFDMYPVCMDFNQAGLNDLQEKHVFSVYPNPSAGQFNISSEPNETYSVYDENGNKLLSGHTTGRTTPVDIVQFANGIYLIEMNDKLERVYLIKQ